MTNRWFGLLALLALGPANAEPALWSVTGKSNTIYLFGSVHVLPAGGFAIDGALKEAYGDAELVCFEVETSKIAPEQMQSVTLARAVDPDGRNLFELLGSSADRARASATTAGIDLARFAPFEPWFAGLMISVLALQQNGYDVEHGVEQIMEAAVARDGKPSCGLETLDEQLGFLDQMPAELQHELLLQSLEEAGAIREVFEPMLAAWRAGDERALLNSVDEDFAEFPQLAEALIYQRNERWADLLGPMLNNRDDILLVVGALHLVGERSVPALLAERGFKVERR